MSDTANPRYPIAGDPFEISPEEREALRIEGMAHGIYSRHAAAMERSGTHVPKWGWLTEEGRENWRMLARERIAEGMNSGDGFPPDADGA